MVKCRERPRVVGDSCGMFRKVGEGCGLFRKLGKGRGKLRKLRKMPRQVSFLAQCVLR